jgi:AcrR family transcriptional regulator
VGATAEKDDRTRRPRSNGNRPADDALLDAASEVFYEVGFHTASMDLIADRADTTKPTLYKHFVSKEGLYQSCLRRASQQLETWLLAAYESAADLTIEQEVHADMLALFEYAVTHPAGFGLLFGDNVAGPNSNYRDALTDRLTTRIADRIRSYPRKSTMPELGPSADLLAAMLVGIAVHGARRALALGADAVAVGELASSLAYAGMCHLDPRTMTAIDAKRARKVP